MLSKAEAPLPMAENRRLAYLGAGYVSCSLFVILCTVWLLKPAPAAVEDLLGAFSASALLAVFSTMLPWERLGRIWLLAYPALGIAAVSFGATTGRSVTPHYAGLFTLAFVYVGFTQSRGVAVACLPVAVPAWLACSGGVTSATEAQLPLTVATWVVVAELLAARATRGRRRAGKLTPATSADSLTGLRSRADMGVMLAGLQAGDGVVLIDLDQLRRVNDEQGRAAGDQVLAEFGAVLRAVIRSGDSAIRYGGDEALLLLPRAGSEGAEALLTRLRGCWRSAARPTFSAGVAVHEQGPAESTLRRAGQALQRAKQAGRDCWEREAASA